MSTRPPDKWHRKAVRSSILCNMLMASLHQQLDTSVHQLGLCESTKHRCYRHRVLRSSEHQLWSCTLPPQNTVRPSIATGLFEKLWWRRVSFCTTILCCLVSQSHFVQTTLSSTIRCYFWGISVAADILLYNNCFVFCFIPLWNTCGAWGALTTAWGSLMAEGSTRQTTTVTDGTGRRIDS